MERRSADGNTWKARSESKSKSSNHRTRKRENDGQYRQQHDDSTNSRVFCNCFLVSISFILQPGSSTTQSMHTHRHKKKGKLYDTHSYTANRKQKTNHIIWPKLPVGWAAKIIENKSIHCEPRPTFKIRHGKNFENVQSNYYFIQILSTNDQCI